MPTDPDNKNLPGPRIQTALARNLLKFRIKEGLTQEEVAERAGITRVGYRRIESGSAMPRVDTLKSIADALGVSIPSLLEPPQNGLREVRFRATSKMNTRQQILLEISRRLDIYDRLEDLLGRRKKFRFAAARASGRRSKNRAKKTAAAARKAIGLKPCHPIRDICGLLEDNGVRVITASIAAEGFFGLSVAQDGRNPAIVVNTWERISVERWIFTAAHELGHLLLHLSAYNVDLSDEDDAEEKEAHAFASHFLMPEQIFWKEWEETRGLSFVDRIFKLKRMFHVSYQPVLYRVAHQAEDHNAIYTFFFEQYWRKTGKRLDKTITHEPEALPAEHFANPIPYPKRSQEAHRFVSYDFREDRLLRLAADAVAEGLVSETEVREMLELSEEDFQLIRESWKVERMLSR